ncbi:MAG TPA: extracellular solute-binding protein [Lacipirellulaceae bacterium]|nr:extracellular solute-binding protein [Lacipirellulaceae bacterium]
MNNLPAGGWPSFMPRVESGGPHAPRRGPGARSLAALLAVACIVAAGCGASDAPRVIHLWHQMRPEDRGILAARIDQFDQANPGVEVVELYKETEELRSGLISAVLADKGPEIVYGPSDVLGVYHAMGALRDMSDWLPAAELQAFDPRAVIRLPARRADQGGAAPTPAADELVFLGDRFGNHLALVYNRKLLPRPPTTTEELVAAARRATIDADGDGTPEQYGLVWNYTEPFFVVPFLTGYGAWVFEDADPTATHATPALNTKASADAYRFVAGLRTEHRVLPASADYEVAAGLFLEGRAAMLIDGDWSWQKYLSAPNLEADVAVLPVVSETGRPMAPMVAPKGYSLTSFAEAEQAGDAMALVRFLTSAETQRIYLEQQRILPSRLALRDDPLVRDDPVMQTSLAQADRGQMMPTALEIRAVWDAMRPPYQLLMAGELDAQAAADRMQRGAMEKIADMTNESAPDRSAYAVYAAGIVAGLALAAVAWRGRGQLWSDLRDNPLAYALVVPSMALIFLTVVYPLVYNIILSFSNMSLTNLRDWELVGLRNYESLATGRNASQFWNILAKTLFWTAVNVTFHVTLGVLLAVTLNGPVRGKSIYRVLLVIPWAVPAYITALTWRGMFDPQFGAVNHAIAALTWINAYLPEALQFGPVNWLGQAGPALAACIIANVWLGFPFMMVITLGGLQGIPAELYEAARIDRASRWQQFRQITLPMLKPVLIPAVTLGAVWTFNNLNVVWLVSNGGEPADQTHILVSYVYKAVFNLYQYGYGAALSMVIFLMLLGFSLVFLRGTRATEAVG